NSCQSSGPSAGSRFSAVFVHCDGARISPGIGTPNSCSIRRRDCVSFMRVIVEADDSIHTIDGIPKPCCNLFRARKYHSWRPKSEHDMANDGLVLVTGSSGRIGRAVVAELEQRRVPVRGFDRVATPGLSDMIVGNLQDTAALDRAASGATTL